MIFKLTTLLSLGLSLSCSLAAAKKTSKGKAYSPTKNGYELVYQDEFNDNHLNTNDWYYRHARNPRLGGYNQRKTYR